MPILIDGHNLIGSGVFDDIRLDQEDDEVQLVARLKVWKSRYKGQFIVYFDQGISHGEDHQLSGAGVTVIFAANPAEADILIRRRVQRGQAGLILVSNDEALRQEASAHNVEIWSGAEFVRRMTLITPSAPEQGAETHVKLSRAEVDEWMSLFDQAKKPPTKQRKIRIPVKKQPRPKEEPGRKSQSKGTKKRRGG